MSGYGTLRDRAGGEVRSPTQTYIFTIPKTKRKKISKKETLRTSKTRIFWVFFIFRQKSWNICRDCQIQYALVPTETSEQYEKTQSDKKAKGFTEDHSQKERTRSLEVAIGEGVQVTAWNLPDSLVQRGKKRRIRNAGTPTSDKELTERLAKVFCKITTSLKPLTFKNGPS